MNDCPVLLLVLIGGIDGFHTHIETQDEIVEVKTYSQAVSHSYLLVELIQLELSAWLLFVGTKGPDVAGIYEERTLELPEQRRAVLGIEVELQIARLVDEVDTAVGASELSWSQLSYTPSSHGVGSTREISFFERQHSAVAIRIGYAEACMQRQGVALVKLHQMGVIEIKLSILSVGYIK